MKENCSDRNGQKFGNYRLSECLGGGGFACVYKAEHIYLKTQAAVKLLQGSITKEEQEAFLIEAQTVARLKHPHIVEVLDFGIEGNTPYLVMAYTPKGSLRANHPKRSLLPLSTVVSYVKQIAEALQYAHDQKVVHRDVKPENMLLDSTDKVLLSDFGIAVIAHKTVSLSTQEAIGTVTYMAPEQIRGKARPASDQYSLGVVVYEWLSGICPFQGTSSIEIAMKHFSDSPPPLREKIPTLSPEVEQVVMKALAKEPENRHRTVMDFANALEKALKHPSLILLNRCQLEDDNIPHGDLAWSPNGKYIGVIGKKTIQVFKAHNGERAFACDHKINDIGAYTLLWDTDSDVNAETITLVYYNGNWGCPVLVDNLTGKAVLQLRSDDIRIDLDGRPESGDMTRFFPDKSQSEYWSDTFVESLKALVGMDKHVSSIFTAQGMDHFHRLIMFYRDCCLWSPDLEHVAIPRARSIDIYKVITR